MGHTNDELLNMSFARSLDHGVEHADETFCTAHRKTLCTKKFCLQKIINIVHVRERTKQVALRREIWRGLVFAIFHAIA